MPVPSSYMFTRLSCQAARAFATPGAIVGVPALCLLWLVIGYLIGSFDAAMLALTLILSVLAITMSSLVLVAQARSEEAIQAKLDELIKSIPDADDAIAGLEKKR